jgi:hypothetical protein
MNNEQKKELLRATAGSDVQSIENRRALAQQLESVWKQGVLEPGSIDTVFSRIDIAPGVDAKFPLDFLSPEAGDSDRFDAVVIPAEGALPMRKVDGDELHVPTYKISNSIAWNLDYARDARWDVITRAIEVFTNGFTRKMNVDGWHTVLAAAAATQSRDTAAASGTFTKLLVTEMQTAMKRAEGGRTARMTDLFLSPEAIADIRNLDGDVVDEGTLRALLGNDGNDPTISLYGVKMHELLELGASQDYTTYYSSTLGQTIGGSDTEICIGLDLANRDSFVMPVREDMQMFDDASLHRSGEAGVYGWMQLGFAVLDARRVTLGSF